MQEWLDQPHRRLNLLTREWVLVSPQRAIRPWQGHTEVLPHRESAEYEPDCYLCPGNARASGARNPRYESTFVFDNDFPALMPKTPDGATNDMDLFVAESERGFCRVVCFSPRHNLTISEMQLEAVESVVNTWSDQMCQLQAIPWIRYVQVFENRGELMGASNPHPHGQIWASQHVPNEIAKEQAGQKYYADRYHSCLLCTYSEAERRRERLVCENSSFIAVVPFWAVWPFEVLLIATRHYGNFDELTGAERKDLASILQTITRRYDALFAVPASYSMGFHPVPRGGDSNWHFHAHFYPPLLRSASIRKFVVGYEMLANVQRDLTPEVAADRLRRAGD
jgi:UDPglucose--hexose-1-phosphate uridylyltransferase